MGLEDIKKLMASAYVRRKAERDKMRAEQERELKLIEKRVSRELMPKLREAHKSDYQRWLELYVNSGFKPTHYYDYPFEQVKGSMYVAREDFESIPLKGSRAISIIVPRGVKFLGGELGHNRIYLEEGPNGKPEALGGIVPLYKDL